MAPSDEGSSPDDLAVGEEPDKNPVLVESTEREPSPPTTLNRDPHLGTILNGQYRVLSLIGKGATSAVYKAKDTTLNQPVAIKILHTHLAADTTIMRRFEQEAKTARLLRHPNIVDVRAYDKTDSGIPFLVMDLVEGTSLQKAIKTSGCLPVQLTIEIFTQVCAALAAAHEKGIVHRDLKPSNIMLTTSADGSLRVKVLDFGIAKILPATGDTVMKLTQTGEMLGSILYMSPEQCLDKDLDGRSDCYSLGCVMYETLTGKPPLSARTAFETMNKHMTEIPARLDRVRPDLKRSPGLQYVVSKAMAKDPDQRYQEISQLQDDLQQLLAAPNAIIPVEAVAPARLEGVVARPAEATKSMLMKYIALGITIVAVSMCPLIGSERADTLLFWFIAGSAFMTFIIIVSVILYTLGDGHR